MANNNEGIVIGVNVINNTKKALDTITNDIKKASSSINSNLNKNKVVLDADVSPLRFKLKEAEALLKNINNSIKVGQATLSSNMASAKMGGVSDEVSFEGDKAAIASMKEMAAQLKSTVDSFKSDLSSAQIQIDTSKIQEATDYLNTLKINLDGISGNNIVKLSEYFAQLKESMSAEQFQKVINEYKRLSETAEGQMIPALKRIQVAHKNVTGKIKKDMKSIQGEFQGWALSVMFFGMALQRTFSTIWKSSTKTFNDVIHSVSGATTGFDRMQSSLTFLQFVAGQALEPLAEAIVPIIMWVANLIENNEKTFRTWVLWAGILGVVFSALGSLVLAFAGLRTLLIYVWGAIKGVGLVAMGLWNAFIWVKNAIILIKTIGFLDWLSTLFPKVAAITTATYGWATAKLALAKASLILAGKLAIVLAAIAAIIFLLLVWDDWLEGMKLSFKVWGVVIKHEFLSLGDRFKILGLQMKISWQGTINSLINIAEKFINGLISAYNAYATVAKKPIIPNIDLSSLKSGIMDTEKELFDLEDKLKQRIFDRDVEVYKVGKELPDVASRVTLGAALDKLMGGTKGEVPLDFSDISNMNKEIEAGVKEVSELDAAFSNLSDTLAEVKLGFSEVVGDYGGYLSELDKTQDSVFSSKDEKEIKNITNTFNISMSPQTGGQSMDEYAENIASIILEKINGA